MIQKVVYRIAMFLHERFHHHCIALGANNQLKENADKLYSKDEDLLFGVEDMASSMADDDQSQMQSQSSLQDLQPMDSSEELL